MTLISVLVALGLDRLLFAQRDSIGAHWCARAYDAIAVRLPSAWDGVGGALLIIALPVILIGAIQWVLYGLLFGLISLLFSIVVLLLSLGPLDIVGLIDRYIEACENEDREQAVWYYERVTGTEPPESVRDEGRRMVESVLYQGHDNLFATVFWFCLLGPVGAVLYRAVAEGALRPSPALVARPGLQRAFRHLLGLLGWIPARLIAFGYAMTGSFEEALHRLREGAPPAEDLLASNRDLLRRTGTASLRQTDVDEEETEVDTRGERRSSNPAPAVAQARALALRTAVFWLAALALLTLAGWFG
ncbi:MAG: regulatory signaling modulator protein AmpE [Halofilum sp. (in: g-proteobacteria)]|nr:regulatory signaling modulator protein AmpE [Halofilum sp. (in: g-proteobacteria)]